MAKINTAYLLDTHPLVFWLLEPKKLSRRAANVIGNTGNFIHIPTVALLEIQYLIEIGRIEATIQDVMASINETPHFSITPFDQTALSQSLQITETRDPFDRMILATALAYDWTMITKDRWMHAQLKGKSLW